MRARNVGCWGVLLALLGGCDSTKVRVHLLPAEELSLPDYVILDLFTEEGLQEGDRKVPKSAIEDGVIRFPTNVTYEIPDGVDGEARVFVRGFQFVERWVGEGVGRARIDPGKEVTVTITLTPTRLPDCDGDRVPDVIDNCPTTSNPDQVACTPSNVDGCVALDGAPVPDAGVPDTHNPDVEAGADLEAKDLAVDARSDSQPVDARPPDTAPTPDTKPVCTPTGVPTACEPITVTGCAAGACYLTTVGTACVCPAGTQGPGLTCVTTTDCTPGHVCVGTAPPGVCRKMCDSGTSKPCPGSEVCIQITLHPMFGYCEPK